MFLKLKAKRVEKGYTQEQIAKLIGVTTVTYCRHERGQNKFTKPMIDKLLEILECKYEDIF